MSQNFIKDNSDMDSIVALIFKCNKTSKRLEEAKSKLNSIEASIESFSSMRNKKAIELPKIILNI